MQSIIQSAVCYIITLLGYFQAENVKKSLSCLKSTVTNFSKCNVSNKTKSLKSGLEIYYFGIFGQQSFWHRSGVFIVSFEHISQISTLEFVYRQNFEQKQKSLNLGLNKPLPFLKSAFLNLLKCKNSCKKNFLRFRSNVGPEMFYLGTFGLEF